MDLGFDTVERGDWTVLTITGEVDVATAPRLREKLVAMVNDGIYHIVVDLDQVEFLDSTGLGVLVGALKRVRGRKGELALVCTRPRIRKGFEITGLTRVFPMHPSVDQAVAADVASS